VLGNLLSNAARYGDPGTPILVEASAGEHEVSVSNHGRGVAPDELPRLFERSSRGRGETAPGRGIGPGLGIGLGITHGLVLAHGGRVAVESVPGETTTFRFTLPLAADSR